MRAVEISRRPAMLANILLIVVAVLLLGYLLLALFAGRGAEPKAVCHGATPRTTVRPNPGLRRENGHADNHATNDSSGAGCLAGSHQDVWDEWRRLLQRKQRAPVRESNAALKLLPDVPDLCDSLCPNVHPGPHGRFPAPWLGRLGKRKLRKKPATWSTSIRIQRS
jgi:hypothetical protein